MILGIIGINAWKSVALVLWITIAGRVGCLHNHSESRVCELSYFDGEKVYSFSLASPRPKYPHGVLSEDGFYKVAANGTVVWFQLCGGMIFNYNPPRCFDCPDCGGLSRCGLECSALVANNIGGKHCSGCECVCCLSPCLHLRAC
uniref:Uncharacterized protein n=1 Tax=Rhizophora mucronata TaxID=61149 RepID=A0A2P2KRS9_RHIMU